MTYGECLEYLYKQLPMFHRIGPAAYKANLDNTIHIMQMLGSPERGFKCIHVAGTNGKGSTSHLLASILQEAGYKTGLFTSPHLKDFRERIRINGKMISRNKVVSFVERYRDGFESIKPSFFEWTAGLAFDHFRNSKVDIAVIETGLGGRLDSTNVVNPLVSLITNVQWDHMNLLGNTLQKIATEKAGIIKPGVPVIIGTTQKESLDVFKAVAAKNHSQISFADKRYHVYEGKNPGMFHYKKTKEDKTYVIRCGLEGAYQKRNLPAVLLTIDELKSQGIKIPVTSIKNGIKHVKTNTGIRGRWETLGKKPLIIADTAHNKDGLMAVMQELKKIKYAKLHVVLGVVNDKDVRAMLSLFPKNAVYYFCKPNIPRGMDVDALMAQAETLRMYGKSHNSVKRALRAAKNKAQPKDLIYVGGSTFVVAEVI
jgi:dihydrofolate synthase/folylpolyglutamate synthase